MLLAVGATRTVVVPYRDPGKLLVAGEKIKIGAIGGQSFPVVVERIDLTVRQRDAAKGGAIAIHLVCILVDVVPEMDDVVDRVLSHGVAIGIEEAERCSTSTMRIGGPCRCRLKERTHGSCCRSIWPA